MINQSPLLLKFHKRWGIALSERACETVQLDTICDRCLVSLATILNDDQHFKTMTIRQASA